MQYHAALGQKLYHNVRTRRLTQNWVLKDLPGLYPTFQVLVSKKYSLHTCSCVCVCVYASFPRVNTLSPIMLKLFNGKKSCHDLAAWGYGLLAGAHSPILGTLVTFSYFNISTSYHFKTILHILNSEVSFYSITKDKTFFWIFPPLLTSSIRKNSSAVRNWQD